jgi:hypothetical protein
MFHKSFGRLSAIGAAHTEGAKLLMSLMPVRSLSEIATEIEREWMPKIAGMAQPYVRAMKELRSLNDHYGLDRASVIVAGFGHRPPFCARLKYCTARSCFSASAR